MEIDRPLQRLMLEHLSEVYPAESDEVYSLDPDKYESALDNLTYLEEHGFVHAGIQTFLDGNRQGTGARITCHGIDFIENDGGITAMLNTVTIKFHSESLRQLIELRVAESNLPAAEKGLLQKAVRELPGEAIKSLTTKLVEKGLDNLPQAVQLIRTLMQGVG